MSRSSARGRGWDKALEDGLSDLSALWLSESREQLYQALLAPSDRGPMADSFEPACLFRAHHEHDPVGGELTTLLLCTDRRWKPASGKLLREIVDMGALGEEQLDELADVLLWTDDLWLELPVAWLDPGSPQTEAAATVPVQRPIHPPLRRWATERRVRRGHDAIDALIARAHALDRPAQGAVTRGLIDAADAFDPCEHDRALALGLTSSQADVRRRALEGLVAAGQAEEAAQLAAADPAAKVRRWGERLDATVAGQVERPSTPSDPVEESPRKCPQPQPGGHRSDGPDRSQVIQGALFT